MRMRAEKLLEGRREREPARAARGGARGEAGGGRAARMRSGGRRRGGVFAASPALGAAAAGARGIVGARPRRAPTRSGAPEPRPAPARPRPRPRPPSAAAVSTGAASLVRPPGSPRPSEERQPPPPPFAMQPASAKWYDRRDYVFIEFCVEDSKDVNVNFEKSKLTFSCLGGSDNFKHLNEIDLFNNIDPNESKHKRTDRSILCCLRKGESGQAWPRLTKERAKLNWLSVDFNNWKDWEDDSDEDMSNFDRFSEMMNNMGGDDDVDLPEVDGADDDSPDSDDEKMPDLE
ncbi:LOW QUALITY PROTEIN: prostaglandin E synthase 3 [Anas acuta]|uniref:LOW QUALITY PROTEIN: prostaglandin E synthase 3 n=1 Tax=Anas acuta TaxID=28680 RepID=UPI0035C8C2CC